MSFVKVNKSIYDRLNLLAKNSNGKSINDLVHEGLSFYLVYLDFLVYERNTVIVLKDLANSEDKEQANADSEKLMHFMFRHFSKDAYNQYFETKKALGFPIPELPALGEQIPEKV